MPHFEPNFRERLYKNSKGTPWPHFINKPIISSIKLSQSTTPEEEVMEAEEDMKEVEDTEVEEEVEKHLAKDKDRSSIIIVDNKVNSYETIQ